jgi:hypothetical protein
MGEECQRESPGFKESPKGESYLGNHIKCQGQAFCFAGLESQTWQHARFNQMGGY